MSSKVNVKDIVAGHLATLCSGVNGKMLKKDVFTFYMLPAVMFVLVLLVGFNLDKDLSSLLVNFGSIITALLLSVLVLVYDQENKLESPGASVDDPMVKVKRKILFQLYYNICYSIICAVVLVVLCFLHAAIKDALFNVDIEFISLNFDFKLGEHLVTPFAVFFAVNLVLTIVMIVKRMHVLLTSNRTADSI